MCRNNYYKKDQKYFAKAKTPVYEWGCRLAFAYRRAANDS